MIFECPKCRKKTQIEIAYRNELPTGPAIVEHAHSTATHSEIQCQCGRYLSLSDEWKTEAA